MSAKKNLYIFGLAALGLLASKINGQNSASFETGIALHANEEPPKKFTIEEFLSAIKSAGPNTNTDSIYKNLSDLQITNMMISSRRFAPRVEIDTVFIRNYDDYKNNTGIVKFGQLDREFNIITLPYYFVTADCDYSCPDGIPFDPKKLQNLYDTFNREAFYKYFHEKSHSDLLANVDFAGLSLQEKLKVAVHDEIRAYICELMLRDSVLNQTGLIHEAFPLQSKVFEKFIYGNKNLTKQFYSRFFWQKDSKLSALAQENFEEANEYLQYAFAMEKPQLDMTREKADAILLSVIKHLGNNAIMESYLESDQMPSFIYNQMIYGYYWQQENPETQPMSYQKFLEWAYTFDGINLLETCSDSVRTQVNLLLNKYEESGAFMQIAEQIKTDMPGLLRLNEEIIKNAAIMEK
ncbi:MAG: hypothetical protein LBJ18_02795 [Rickettsiales bacterium]|jgi:hypothetical protein|nr:hypothetical protein [Rickettsiales bacterium]